MADTDSQKSRWPLVVIVVTAAALLGAGYMVWRTMPPRTLVMATG